MGAEDARVVDWEGGGEVVRATWRVVEGEGRSRTRRWLAVALVLTGCAASPPPSVSPSSLPPLLQSSSVERVEVEAVRQGLKQGELTLFDIRPRSEFEFKHIPGARWSDGLSLPPFDLRSTPLVIYCA